MSDNSGKPTTPVLPSEEETPIDVSTASQWKLMWWKFRRHKLAMASMVVLVLFYFGVVFAEFVSPHDPRQPDKRYLHAPPHRLRFIDQEGNFSIRPFVYPLIRHTDPKTLVLSYTEDRERKLPIRLFVRGDSYEWLGLIESDLHLIGVEGDRLFLFGADKQGRDVLSRIVFGGRISLTVPFVGIAISFILGILLGGISGLFGGVTDTIIQRIIEFIRSIPTLPLWMGLSAALPPYWSITQIYFGIVIILSIVGWTGLARVVRGKFLALKAEDFVMAARLDNVKTMRVIFRYLLPSFLSYMIARLTLSIPGMIIGETSLSFIGLGLQPPAISWGVLLKEAQSVNVLAKAPWLLIPGIFVVVSILAFNFVGDGIRDAADPYAKV
jgi:peptide/nickel transport system permease protein